MNKHAWLFEDSKYLIYLVKCKTPILEMLRHFPGRDEAAIRRKIARLGYSTKGL